LSSATSLLDVYNRPDQIIDDMRNALTTRVLPPNRLRA
jgi:hypothetical protein